jgi:dTDP-4-dehydrorhamnose reductase
MKILLLGANGQVGHELRRSLAPLGEIIATTRNGHFEDGSSCEIADLDKPDSLNGLVERIAPDWVVNAAAYTAVDRAESETDVAFRANAESPGVLAAACARRGAKLVHFSTDYIFPGDGSRPYREDDATSPLGVYGTSKLAGEEAIRAVGDAHLIFRTAWVYASHGKNFLRTMLRLGAEREELRVVADQIGTPTPAALIADITAQVMASSPQATGVFHLTAQGQCSWQEFATAIFAGAHRRDLIARAPRVLPITTADYPTPARRPAYSCLDTARLRNDLAVALPTWEQGLDRVLDELAIKA